MASDTSKELSKLAIPFHKLAHELRSVSPLWEELAGKAAKVQRQFEACSLVLLNFFETLQKVADAASSSSGGTRDLGTCLTKITLRHRNIAEGYAKVASAFGEDFARTVMQKMEERRKALVQMEREHEKDFKHWKSDLKKVNVATLKLSKEVQKKKKAAGATKGDLNEKLEESLENAVEQYEEFEAYEQLSLRHILLEQRLHYCALLQSMKPFLAAEVSLLDEVFHLQEVQKESDELISNSNILPQAGMDVASSLQLDLPSLFKGASVESPVLAQVRKQADERAKTRNSLLSLVPSDNFSIDSLSVSEAAEGSSSASLSLGSPSLSAVRLEPEGSSGAGSQYTPDQEPTYADIDLTIAEADMSSATTQSRAHPPSAVALSVISNGSAVKSLRHGSTSSTAQDRETPASVHTQSQSSIGNNSSVLNSAWHGIGNAQKPASDVSAFVSQPYDSEIYTAVEADEEEEWPAIPDDLPPPPPPEELSALAPPSPTHSAESFSPAVKTVKKATPPTRPKPGKSASSFSLQYDYVQTISPAQAAPAPNEYAEPRATPSPQVQRHMTSSSLAQSVSVCQYEDTVEQGLPQARHQHQAPSGVSYTSGDKPSTTAMVKELRRRTGSFGNSEPRAGSPASPQLKARLPTPGKTHNRAGSPRVMTMDV